MREVDSLWSYLNFFIFSILNRACQVGKQYRHDWRLKPDPLHHTQQPWVNFLAAPGWGGSLRPYSVLDRRGECWTALAVQIITWKGLWRLFQVFVKPVGTPAPSEHSVLSPIMPRPSITKGLCAMPWLPGCVAKCREMKAHGGWGRDSRLLWVPAAEKPVAGGLAWWPLMMLSFGPR